MKEEILFRMKSPYRDEFKIRGFRFGKGKKSVAIVGAMRGDEIQQQFTCSQIVKNLMEIEQAGLLTPGFEILVIPAVNHFSMNIDKRFWAMDNTDINRMFPGYEKGETTQRIAAAVFESVKEYEFGIQLASFYLPGQFTPHVRMMDTGFQDIELAKQFGLPYVLIRKPRPYDTTLLNYNWQVFGTKAFSIYAGDTSVINKDSSKIAWTSILRFLHRQQLIQHPRHKGHHSSVITDEHIQVLISQHSGIIYTLKEAGDEVKKGDLLAKILDPFVVLVKLNLGHRFVYQNINLFQLL